MTLSSTFGDNDLAKVMADRINAASRLSSSQTPRRRYRLMRMEEVLAESQTVRWLINGFIEEGNLVVLFGESGSMKSFVALDMALCISTGLDWHGNPVQINGPVIYIAGEGFRGLQKRMQAWVVHNQIQDPASVPCIVGPGPIDLRDKQAIEDLSVTCEEMTQDVGQPRMIVIDTLSRNFGPGGDENSTGDMTGFVAALDELKERFGCAVLVVHHTGQGDKSRARGSSVLKGAADFEFRLSVSGNTRVLTCTKAKEHEYPEPITFSYEQVGTGMTDTGTGFEATSLVLRRTSNHWAGCQANHNPPELSRSEQIALGAFESIREESGNVRIGAWRERAYAMSISPTSTPQANQQAFLRARNRLLALGLIQETSEVGVYRLTEESNPNIGEEPGSDELQ